MSALGGGKANELTFQNDMLKHLLAKGWLLGKAENYNRELALYPEDLLGLVQDTQPGQWQKLREHSPSHPKQSFFKCVASQLNKTAANVDSGMRALCAPPTPADHHEPTKAFW
jgi:type I restriction enzyme R subunit